MRNVKWGAFAAGLVLAFTSATWADNTVRLGGPSAQASIDGGTDISLVHGRYRGGYHGGYYGGRGYSAYYGNRGYGGGYYRPYVSVGFYGRPSYYYPRTYSYYYPTYYPAYYPTYYVQPSYYYYPVAGETPPPVTLQSNYPAQLPRTYVPPMPPAQGEGPFPYDGDPRNLVPLPAPQPNPAAPRIIPIDGRLVSLPNEISGGVSQIGTPTPRAPVPRVPYPAYGDEPITPAPRKLNR